MKQARKKRRNNVEKTINLRDNVLCKTENKRRRTARGAGEGKMKKIKRAKKLGEVCR